MSQRNIPVLIVGGALTGLSAAVFLAWHGVPCVLVERHPDLLIHPRLRGVNPRTMELLRQVGLESAVKKAGFTSRDWSPVIARTLADEEYVRPDEPDTGFDPDASPCSYEAIDQDRLEILLRARAEELGADIRFSTELSDLSQDADGVTAVITDLRDGTAETIRAGHLVAADGAAGGIRERLGVPVDGPGVLAHVVTVMADADLTPALRGRPVSIAYLNHPRPGTVLMAHDEAGKRWIFGVGYSPDDESPADYPPERCAALLREAAGTPDAEVTIRPQIPGTETKVLGFTLGARLARDYRVGRILIAGDAAHIVPPTGGLGGNTCVQDAHNLAWKLAAVLGGQAGPALLDTYDAERRPVGALTLTQAQAHAGGRMGLGDGRPAELVETDAIVFGYGYRSAAVAGGGAGRPLLPRELGGRPGHRAPHVPVRVAGRPMSTLDLYGRRWVLLSGPAGDWPRAAEEAGRELDLPIDVHRFGEDLDGDDLEARHGIGPEGALLVRPDGFVAWRCEDAGPRADVAGVLRRLLCR
ncbi:FAD-dependent oxidoreductase [Actinoallomurus oryzae]|uniref:FAD-dependent oxidoreductase n=1 Tax=Actinoallomurus oryzae TaxID=502180 RepID=A0ABP8P7D9_9ACTN